MPYGKIMGSFRVREKAEGAEAKSQKPLAVSSELILMP
jgi:hypothetical protein